MKFDLKLDLFPQDSYIFIVHWLIIGGVVMSWHADAHQSEFKKGWTLKPSLVSKSINFGTTNAQKIDLALKVRSCQVISPMHRMTCLKI